MQDNLFSKSVIFVCEHNSNGAVGLIINKRLDDMLSSQIYSDLNRKTDANLNRHSPLYIGCLLYTSPSPRDVEESRMPSSA